MTYLRNNLMKTTANTFLLLATNNHSDKPLMTARNAKNQQDPAKQTPEITKI